MQLIRFGQLEPNKEVGDDDRNFTCHNVLNILFVLGGGEGHIRVFQKVRLNYFARVGPMRERWKREIPRVRSLIVEKRDNGGLHNFHNRHA